jgi:predicted metalloprotease
VALEAVLELVDACDVVEPSLCCGEVIEAVAFDAGDGAFQRAVGFVVLEEEDCGTRRDRIVVADGGSLPRRGDGLVVALVEPDNATRIRIGGK